MGYANEESLQWSHWEPQVHYELIVIVALPKLQDSLLRCIVGTKHSKIVNALGSDAIVFKR